jgi:hypothetical protein
MFAFETYDSQWDAVSEGRSERPFLDQCLEDQESDLDQFLWVMISHQSLVSHPISKNPLVADPFANNLGIFAFL